MNSDDFFSEIFEIILNMEDDNKKPVGGHKEKNDVKGNKITADKTVKLSAPWVTYANEVKAMFGRDPEIEISFCNENETPEIKMLIGNRRKYEALRQLLPEEKEFGNVKLKITLTSAEAEPATAQTILAAFEGNPVFSQVITIDGAYGNPITYVMFGKEAVQYWNDNMADPHGMVTTLYQYIARRLFNPLSGVMYSTESDAGS